MTNARRVHAAPTGSKSVAPRRRAPRSFGTVRKLPSGRFQASYLGRDDERHKALDTFLTRGDADGWLSAQRTALDVGTWRSPKSGTIVLRDYAVPWLEGRTLKPRTRAHYRDLLNRVILPEFGDTPLARISPAAVRAWHAGIATPTTAAHAYGLLRTIMGTAVSDDLIAVSPCRVRGGGSSKRKTRTVPATLAELEAIVAAMPEQYRAMVLLAAWCSLRFGELAELRRKDLDLVHGTVSITRAVVWVGGSPIVGDPKTDAGTRVVTIPSNIVPALKRHLRTFGEPGRDGLLFPAPRTGGHLSTSSLYRVWWRARKTGGRTDLRFHDLRHTGLTLSAAAGATIAELMDRAGHTTAQAAMVYQHSTADRQRAIADALAGFSMAKVVALRPASGSS
jgi:integrase